MRDGLRLVLDLLTAGMTTGQDSAEPWYIKTWYDRPPIEFMGRELPLAVLVPGDDSQVDQYVQEDTEVLQIVVHFYPTPISRTRTVARTLTVEVDDVAEDQVAMVDRAIQLVRMDPTFGSEVYDAKVLGSVYRQPGFVGGGAVHMSELRLQLKRRRPWQQP